MALKVRPLAPLFQLLVDLPSSEALVERNFSLLKKISTGDRSRISNINSHLIERVKVTYEMAQRMHAALNDQYESSAIASEKHFSMADDNDQDEDNDINNNADKDNDIQ